MFWDNVAWVYDIFANVINAKADRALCAAVEGLISPADEVLECACGTGLLTSVIAPRCRSLVATDFSSKMLDRAKKKFGKYPNISFERADVLSLPYPDGSFDAVVAANVIHLLDEPYRALHELERVCRAGGRIIIPTYMNQTDKGTTNSVSGAIGKAGADFKREFTSDTYRQFFEAAGYTDGEYTLCGGRVPCAVAVLRKERQDESMRSRLCVFLLARAHFRRELYPVFRERQYRRRRRPDRVGFLRRSGRRKAAGRTTARRRTAACVPRRHHRQSASNSP